MHPREEFRGFSDVQMINSYSCQIFVAASEIVLERWVEGHRRNDNGAFQKVTLAQFAGTGFERTVAEKVR